MSEGYYEVEEIQYKHPKVKIKKKDNKKIEIIAEIQEQYKSSNIVTSISLVIFFLITCGATMGVFEFAFVITITGLGITFFYNSYIRYSIYTEPKRSMAHRLVDLNVLLVLIVLFSLYLIYAYILVDRLDFEDDAPNGYIAFTYLFISLFPSFILMLVGYYLMRKYPIDNVDMKLYTKMHQKK
jgi:hypothetical protein